MDNALQALLSWQFIFFCLGIATITYVFRIISEYLMNNYKAIAKESKLWTELILPLLPMIIGVSAALSFKNYPYPEGITSKSARFVFGLVAGLLSGLVYRMVKSFLAGKIKGYMATTSTNGSSEGDVGASRADHANNG